MAAASRPPVRSQIANPIARQRVVTLVMLAALVIFAGKLIFIQGVQASALSQEALNNRLTTTKIEPQRADIVDRNGVVFATSVNRYHLTVNQPALADWKHIENGQVLAEGPLDAARILAPLLDVGESELAAALSGDKPFAYVAKDITPETWSLVRAERIAGIGAEPTTERIYPNGNIGGNVVGFVGGKEDAVGTNWGLSGIELMFEETLLGEPGSMTYERGGGGTIIPTGVREEDPAVPGSTVVLTLDRDLQWMVQETLEEAVKDTGAEGGYIVVSDVTTGEVLALADAYTVDPNSPGSTPADKRASRAIMDVFEPGSTSKIITMAAALEEGVATPLSKYVAPYEYTTSNNQTFRDSHYHPDQKLTLAGVFVTSSNTGTIQIGQEIKPDVFHDYLSRFGYGQRTGVGLPGESAGILHPADRWDGRSRFAILYGQAVSVTALQTNQVYATIANGGVKVPMTVVKGYEQPDGTFVPRELPEPERVVSEQTAHDMLLMMESVTEEGTGRLARIEGYRVAGKTGTAEVLDGTDGPKKFVSSFVGVAPADDPRVVVSVILYNPQTSIWGGEVAAPVFRDVTTYVLQSLRIPPSAPREEVFPTTWE